MPKLSHEQVKTIVGAIDDEKIAAIIATGAGIADVEEAHALSLGTSDLTGVGEKPSQGLAVEVLSILTSD